MRWQITFHNLISILKETQVLLSESHAFKILIPTGNTISESPDSQEKPVPFLPNTMLETTSCGGIHGQRSIFPNNIQEQCWVKWDKVLKQASCAERVNMIWPSPRFHSREASHLKWTWITDLLWALEFVQINNTWHTEPQVLSWSHISYNWLIIWYQIVK